MDVRFREKFQDALAVVISDEERAGLDILTHGDFHCDEDLAGRAWHHYPLQRWAGFEGDYLQSEETRAPWLHYPPGTLLNEIYTGWRWPHVVDKIEHRPLDYAKIWRIAQGKTRKPVKFGTCCSQVMGAVPRHPHAEVQGQARGDLGHGRGDEQGAAGAARRRLPVHPDRGADASTSWPTPSARTTSEVKFMIDALQPRGAGPGRRGDLDPHLLGQPEHAARDGGHQLRGVVRALPRTVPRRRLDDRDEGPQLQRTSSCSRRSRTICRRRSASAPSATARCRPTGRRTWPARSARR